MDALRVLVCIEALGLGGKERQAVELIKGLAARPDVQCRALCLEGDDFYLDKLAGFEGLVEFMPRRRRWDPSIFGKIYSRVSEFRPHVVHTNGLMSSFYCLPIARLMRLPLINGSIRNAFTPRGTRWHCERWLLRASDIRVANSRAGLHSRGFREGGDNLVVYNGFDFRRVEFGVDCAGSGLGLPKRTIVGMVAEFSKTKDYPTFLEAARILCTSRDDVEFVAVGSGPTLADCQKAAEGIPRMTFLGKRKNVEQIVASFDIGVLSSFVEGFSNSIMEYMALAKPVVATLGGGTDELVQEGQTGFLVPSGNVHAMVERIQFLLDHPDAAKRIGMAGQARLKQEFSLDRMVEKTVSVYRQAVLGKSATSIEASQMPESPRQTH